MYSGSRTGRNADHIHSMYKIVAQVAIPFGQVAELVEARCLSINCGPRTSGHHRTFRKTVKRGVN
jgi:hypothetical protein